MAQAVRTLVAIDAGVSRHTVHSALPVDAELMNVVGVVEGLEESWNTLQEIPVDLLLVACTGYSDRTLFFIEGAVKQNRDRPVVVLCDGSPNGFVRRIFEAGADDIIRLPESADNVGFTLHKALARRHGAVTAAGTALARMICVLGPKGGTGKTLTSCNLAVSLAAGGRRVVLVDLDLQFGDVGLALGLSPERTIYDLASSGGSLDGDKVDAYLATHAASGIRVLLAPTRPDQASHVSVDFLRDLYSTLRATADYVVVDTPPGFTPEVIASIDSSSDVCMVGMLDSLSLKNTKLGLETLSLMGYDQDRIRLVLNRAGSRVGIDQGDVLAIVGREPDVFVPSDREIPRAVNEGVPIALSKERSEAAKAFSTLASLYTTNDAAAAATHAHENGRRGGFLATLRKKA